MKLCLTRSRLAAAALVLLAPVVGASAQPDPLGSLSSAPQSVGGLPAWASPAPAAPTAPAPAERGPTLPPAPPVGVPIDGGLIFLGLAGAGLAARKLRRRTAVTLIALSAAAGAQSQTTVTAQLTGGPGWRMLGVPVTGQTVGTLAGQNLVQGVTGQYPTAGDNLFVAYNGDNSDNSGSTRRGFIPAGNVTEGLTPGRGFIWYFYDQNLGAAAGGTSQSVELPAPLTVTGTPASSDWSLLFPSRLLGSADGFYLISNPYTTALDLSGVSAGAVGLGSLQNAFQVWNPNSGQTTTEGNGTPGSYEVVNRTLDVVNSSSDDLAPWQGAFAEINALLGTNLITTFTFDSSSLRGGAPPFYGRPGKAGETEMSQTEASTVAVLRFRLGGATAAGQAVYDAAAAIAFTDVSTAAWDSYDATKLASLDSPAWIAAVGAGRSGEPVEKAQEALPLDLHDLASVPLHLTTSEAGAFTLGWDGLEALPAAWTLTLTDLATNVTVDLRAESNYPFDAAAGEGTARFVLAVRPATTASDDAPQAAGYALSPVGPNPASGSARATLRVDTPQHVRAALYDALGRRVAGLYDGAAGAGADVSLYVDGRTLAPGMYVIRVEGETFAASRPMTVYR